MTADAPLQAWLDAQAADQQVIAPYVRSAVAVTLAYDLRVVRRGAAGRAETRQNGYVQLPAGQATPLGTRLSVNAGAHDTCSIELMLQAHGQPAQRFDFACPRRQG